MSLICRGFQIFLDMLYLSLRHISQETHFTIFLLFCQLDYEERERREERKEKDGLQGEGK